MCFVTSPPQRHSQNLTVLPKIFLSRSQMNFREHRYSIGHAGSAVTWQKLHQA